jgi:ferredoxin-thioredoxin reductase catalytic chain
MILSEAEPKSSDRALEAMRHFSEQYAKRTNTYFCTEPSVTAVVIEDKEAEVNAAYWNCPCVPMRERKECHCMLFLTPDNEFAGSQQEISLETIKQVRDSMG